MNSLLENPQLILWRNRVQINSLNAIDYEICFVLLTMLLNDKEGNIFLESLTKKEGVNGDATERFQKANIDAIVSLYLDLIHGKIDQELVELSKMTIKMTLLSMLNALEEIGNED